MAKRVGWTTDLEVAKWEMDQKFRNTRNWQATPEFASQKEAEAWVEKAKQELSCKDVQLKTKKKAQKMRWFGFAFEHDGPK